ncbi:PREDICTED: AP2-like ethylene-responsive transcription factor AIL6 [Camelina sativa]|uniref:AP2-like ethylene-responsive transcription factor AIL6 n=1 Tax=Camelina sativa TaxID=90675 RepID=A0ABM0V9T4_CAMSA|nr:PREDICTED: AP2-like ethylene-responsive transcription factor AIL6 [Camelina sativa]
MAPMTNWLTFSLSPMEMLRSSDQSQFVSYDASSAASSSPYLLDNFYGWTNQKPQEFFKDEAQLAVAASMADSTILTTFVDPQSHSQSHIPKLEDFLGDSSSMVRYSDNSQTETQDSSLTQIYDPRHHQNHHHNQTGFYSDHHDFKTMAGFQTAFSTNSGSEVDDSASIGRTHLAGEYLGHVVESSSGPDLGFHGGSNNTTNTGGALSLGVNVNNSTNQHRNDNEITNHHYRGGGERNNNNNNNNNENNEKTESEKEKPIVAVETSDCSNKKIADTFGQRTSIYRGVTRHRWTGRYEAHLWDNSCRREGQARKGRQVYLGGYDKEDKAARAYDLAALKYWNATATTNFPITNYSKELEDMKHMTKQEFIASLRRKSSGFSRGASIYRGVTRHHQQGRWQARIGRVAGNKDLYLGTFATEEEAAEAYDIAAIKFRGINAVTNFEMNRYDVEAIMKSALPIGGAAKRLKLSLEAASSEQKPILGHQLHHFQQQQQQQQQLQLQSSPNHSSINFALCPNPAVQSQQIIPCGIPFEAAALYHHQQQQQQQQQNFFQHFPANAASDSTGSNNNSNVQGSMGLMAPNPAEFFLWPNNQSY